ncbi:2-oxo acid dehydrogenase subunit E2 [Streptosporangium sandarakinum]|uniref:Dihydrolipoamide acetyltransferase component of pyruvate dehydrogenase complex n=1 Tax=Streptosporangium sandarakinum TaxID=1260955 RepID=A0A852V0G9_9ACTN|nr:2-oxo acid dehydrogenase subunit E2 [Streptosporangium sandarakinum]NYF43377.1 2-oxoglutarate dehydrogenase E2 component (dihydrolipoamide succinyltransferase) [Streptosporangium sandarakinum]
MIEIRVPKLNNNDAAYLLVEWTAEDGQAVRGGDPLVVLETSKAAEELTAEADGTLLRLLAEGAECAPGQVIARLLGEGEEPGGPAGAGSSGRALPPADPAGAGHREAVGAGGVRPDGSGGPGGSVADGIRADGAGGSRDPEGVVITEPARRFMAEHGIPAGRVLALGRKLVRRVDLEPLVAPGVVPASAASAPGPEGTGQTGAGRTEARQDEAGQAGAGPDEAGLIGLSRNQRRVAEVVERSHREIPAAFTAVRVDVTEALAHARRETRRVRALVGLPELLVGATGRLLDRFPLFFAAPVDGRRARPASSAHVGVTVDVGGGMFVPVVRDAGRRPLGEVARDLTRFRETALNGVFRERDLSGGNITITLHTDAAVVAATPIVFPGQICALSLTAPRPEVVAERGGGFAVRKVITLGLAYDHRFVNGRGSAEFLGALRAALEAPEPPEITETTEDGGPAA